MAYTTLDQVKQYLRINAGETFDDDLINACIARSQAYIDGETHRTFESFVATRLYNAEKDVPCSTQLSLDYDLLEATAITNGNGEAIDMAEPTNNSPKYMILLKSGSWTWTGTPIDAISVTGTWGYSATAPKDIEQACLRLTAFLYRQKDAQLFDVTSYYEGGLLNIPQGVPAFVSMVIGRYRRTL